VREFILKRHVPSQSRWAFDDNDIETVTTRIDSRPPSHLETVRPGSRTEKKGDMSYRVNLVKVRQARNPRVDLLLHSTARHAYYQHHRCAACQHDFAELDEIRKPHGCEHLYHYRCILAVLPPDGACPDISHHS